MPVNCWNSDEVGAFLASLLPSHAVLKLLAREDAVQVTGSTAVMIEVREGAFLFSHGPWNYRGEVVFRKGESRPCCIRVVGILRRLENLAQRK